MTETSKKRKTLHTSESEPDEQTHKKQKQDESIQDVTCAVCFSEMSPPSTLMGFRLACNHCLCGPCFAGYALSSLAEQEPKGETKTTESNEAPFIKCPFRCSKKTKKMFASDWSECLVNKQVEVPNHCLFHESCTNGPNPSGTSSWIAYLRKSFSCNSLDVTCPIHEKCGKLTLEAAQDTTVLDWPLRIKNALAIHKDSGACTGQRYQLLSLIDSILQLTKGLEELFPALRVSPLFSKERYEYPSFLENFTEEIVDIFRSSFDSFQAYLLSQSIITPKDLKMMWHQEANISNIYMLVKQLAFLLSQARPLIAKWTESKQPSKWSMKSFPIDSLMNTLYTLQQYKTQLDLYLDSPQTPSTISNIQLGDMLNSFFDRLLSSIDP